MSGLRIEHASIADHDEICELAKTSKFTGYFASHPFFTRDWKAMYLRKEVGVVRDGGKRIVAFVYVKHLSNRPYSKLHFMTVHPSAQRRGIGAALIAWGRATTPHAYMRLMCELENEPALAFYRSQGGRELRLHTTRSGYKMVEFEFSSTSSTVSSRYGRTNLPTKTKLEKLRIFQ